MKVRELQWFVALLLIAGMAGCSGGGGGGGSTTTPANQVTIKGTVAVPDTPPNVTVLSATQNLAYHWQRCSTGVDSTGLSGGAFILESTNNCAGAQYVYFSSSPAKDMTTYANGSITFKIQVDNTSQRLDILIQDANSTVSNKVNLASYGYDPTKVAVNQAITIPLSALKVTNFNFLNVDRLFQINVTCAASQCLTTLSDIKWMSPGVLAAGQFSAVQKEMRSPRLGTPHCDPFPCRSLPNAPVRILRPSTSGWKAEPAVAAVTTDSNGIFTITADTDILRGGGPIFIGVSDLDGTFTLLSAIPNDLITSGATIDLAVDRTTTAAGIMVCPNGMTIPADGSGGYCIGDPISSSALNTLYTTCDLSLTTTASADLDIFLPDVLDDPSVMNSLNNLLSTHSIPQVTAQQVITTTQNAQLPICTSSSSSSSNSGGSSCGGSGTVTCSPSTGGCGVTVSACVNTGAAWYKVNESSTYCCASQSNCSAAAQTVANLIAAACTP